MFTENDLKLIESRSMTKAQIEDQLQYFKKGFPYLKLVSASTIGKGIVKMSEVEEKQYIDIWNDYLNKKGSVLKFVPASGAASRMFKDLFSFLDSESELPENDFIKKFFEKITDFAFYDDLDQVVVAKTGMNIQQLIENKRYKDVVRYLLKEEGLNYGNLPKAMLEFHKINGEVHTAIAEHFEEGAQYASNNENVVNIHFTVSKEHRQLFVDKINEIQPQFSSKFGVKYDISMSEQKSSTDTIAVNPDNTPFRDNGNLLFRPGGHGALIENLNDVNADVVFIKNIDNVVPATLREPTIKYKKIIGGLLIKLQNKISEYMTLLEGGQYTNEQLQEVKLFLEKQLFIGYEKVDALDRTELVEFLKGKLNRPIRICGVVKNEGEPGGGPYVAYNQDGTTSLQILESSQIDKNDNRSMSLMQGATHFNPVDLVCYIVDYKGNKFDLPKYVDKNTGFISEKSKSGRPLKALELPGLWNGAMSDWNTVFVEVPIETFNPVKTVNDLLRDAHQG